MNDLHEIFICSFSTNPAERIINYSEYTGDELTISCVAKLEGLLNFINEVQFNKNLPKVEKKRLLMSIKDKPTKQLTKIINSLILHMNMLGIYGGSKATLAYIIQIERMKRHADSNFLSLIYTTVVTTLTAIKRLLDDAMSSFNVTAQIHNFSSPKVRQLIEILRPFQKEEDTLCGIVFVQQRFTSKALYYILKDLAEHDSEFSFIRCDFMFGYNAGSADRDTRETFYAAKMNKKIVNSFRNEEINLLIASNVVEEGIDIPKCTLVIKFDRPLDYRSYIQSKGRARHNTGKYIMMVPNPELLKYQDKYKKFQQVERMLQEVCIYIFSLKLCYIPKKRHS